MGKLDKIKLEDLAKMVDDYYSEMPEIPFRYILALEKEVGKLRQVAVMLSLPDDEGIEKKAHEWLKANYGKYKPSEWRAFIEAATWMRELSKGNGA
jgi:hypothetical protein